MAMAETKAKLKLQDVERLQRAAIDVRSVADNLIRATSQNNKTLIGKLNTIAERLREIVAADGLHVLPYSGTTQIA